MNAQPYKFNLNSPKTLDDLRSSFEYRVFTALNDGRELDREIKNALAERLVISHDKGALYLGGWCFPVWQFLKEYFVEFTYDHIEKYWAPDKTSLRACLSDIKRIVEVK